MACFPTGLYYEILSSYTVLLPRRFLASRLTTNPAVASSNSPPLAISSLIHVPKSNFRNEIHKIANLLYPSGILLISMLLGEGETEEDPHDKGVKRHFSHFQKEELEAIFEEETFIILESKEVEVERMNKTFVIYVLRT